MLKRNQCQQIKDQITANISQNMGVGPALNMQQIPAAYQTNNIRDLQKRINELDTQLAKCYLKLGKLGLNILIHI